MQMGGTLCTHMQPTLVFLNSQLLHPLRHYGLQPRIGASSNEGWNSNNALQPQSWRYPFSLLGGGV